MQERTKRRIQFGSGPPALCHLSADAGILPVFLRKNTGEETGARQNYRYNLELFREIGRFWTYREQLGFWPAFLNIGGNIIGFLPFGLLMPVMHRNLRKSLPVILLGFSLSLLVESLQLVLKVGSFDVDDLLLNTVGAAAGYFLYWVCNQIRRKFHGKAI